jgi:hypothetical protein
MCSLFIFFGKKRFLSHTFGFSANQEIIDNENPDFLRFFEDAK